MTPLVERALSNAGLLAALDARASGAVSTLEALRPAIDAADWLLLGALADAICEREVGAAVRVFANAPLDAEGACIDLVGNREDAGIPFLRRVALARVFSPPSTRIRVGWDGLGLEFAQVALSFGASELFGAIRFKDGELVTVDALLGHGKKSRLEPAQVVKRREIARFLARARRTALFATGDGTFEEYTDEPVLAEHGTATSPEVSLP